MADLCALNVYRAIAWELSHQYTSINMTFVRQLLIQLSWTFYSGMEGGNTSFMSRIGYLVARGWQLFGNEMAVISKTLPWQNPFQLLRERLA